MRKVLRFLVILGLLTGTGLYLLYRNQQFLPLSKLPKPLINWLGLTETQDVGKVLGQATKNLDIDELALDPNALMTSWQRTLQGVNQGRRFFQGLVQVDETKGENFIDRTFKYATYIYCKQVVSEWEKNSP